MHTFSRFFRLAREGDGSSGPMGVKSITKHLNMTGIRTATADAGASAPFTRC